MFVTVLVLRIRRVATEGIIVLNLLSRQQTPLGKMGTQMHIPQLSVVASNGTRDLLQRFLRDRLGRKQLVKAAFFRDEQCPQASRLLAHGRVNVEGLRALVFRKM